MAELIGSALNALGSNIGPLESVLGNTNHDQRYYHEVYHESTLPHHKANFTHEVIAGAAGFAAMHAYESHLRATGKEPSHALMKEILAGIAAAEIEKLIETKGLDMIDRHKAKKMAAERAQELAQMRYDGGVGWEYAQAQAGHAMAYNYTNGPPWGMQRHPAYPAILAYPSGGPEMGYPSGYVPEVDTGYAKHQRCSHGHLLHHHCHHCRRH